MDTQQADIDDVEMNAMETYNNVNSGLNELEKVASFAQSNQRIPKACLVSVAVLAFFVLSHIFYTLN